MKTHTKFGIGLALVAAALTAWAAVNCPIDNNGMFFTGKTRTERGKLLYEYQCPSGHTTWVVQ